MLKLTVLVLRASIEKVILFLKDLSQDYSAVSHKLKEEKEQFKHQMKVYEAFLILLYFAF